VREAYDSGTANLHVKPGSVPTLLLHGRGDELVWYKQSERFATRLREANVPHCFLTLSWATHAFDHNFNGPGGQVGSWAIERFLASITAGEGKGR
jgi:dipeptidyl aminopeptidase/acylaminoacyl peptidase